MENLRPSDLAALISGNATEIGTLLKDIGNNPDAVKAVANGINMNPEFLANTMKNSEPADTAAIINENPDLVTKLVGLLSPDVLANVMSANPNAIAAMLKPVREGGLDPAVIKGLLADTRTSDFISEITANSSVSGTVAALKNSGSFISGLLNKNGGLQPEVLVQAIQSMPRTYGFGLTQLIAHLKIDLRSLGLPIQASDLTLNVEGWSTVQGASVCQVATVPYGWDSNNNTFAPW
jgi:hypothetical protein